jgi:hypothetical protein
MKTVTIEVTQEDIEKGQRKDGCNCPIAKAIKRAIPGCCVSVATRWVVLSINGEFCGDSFLPEKALKFIADFDNFNPISPFTFQLEVPE